jgi:hypothetical protein
VIVTRLSHASSSPSAMPRRKPTETPIRDHLPPFTDEQTSYLNTKLDDFFCAKKKTLGYQFCQILHNTDLRERWPPPPLTAELLALCDNDEEKAKVKLNKLRIAVSLSRHPSTR